MPELRQHHKKNKVSSNRLAQVGDIVSIYKYPRENWPLGLITTLIPGKEGCRAAAVRALDNAKKTIYSDRSLKELYTLEIRTKDEESRMEFRALDQELEITIVRDENVVDLMTR